MKKIKKILIIALAVYVVLPFWGWKLEAVEDVAPSVTDNSVDDSQTEIILSSPEVTSTPIVAPNVVEPESGETLDETEVIVEKDQSIIVPNEDDLPENDTQADSNIITGDVSAYATIINLVNVNLRDSQLKVFTLNNFSGNIDEINLDKLWNEPDKDDNLLKTAVISDHQLVYIDNRIEVLAESGANQTTNPNGTVLIVTGDAVAVASVINLVNVNLSEAKLFIGLINIKADTVGDIILPNPEDFQEKDVSINGYSDSNTTIENQVDIKSNSGGNIIQSAESTVLTGNAQTIINNYSDIGKVTNDSELVLIINFTGSNSGNIINGSSPGSIETIANLNRLIYYHSPKNNDVNGTYMEYRDETTVNNNIWIKADSGNNSVLSETATVVTGTATAIANIINLVNNSFTESNHFISFINIAGNWGGNLIFAYPDVEVKLESLKNEYQKGEVSIYRLRLKNIGYRNANSIKVEMTLPSGMKFEKSEIRHTYSDDKKIEWQIDKLEPKQETEFLIYLTTSDLTLAGTSGKNIFLKPVYAAEDQLSNEVVIETKASISQTESSIFNNRSEVVIVVYENEASQINSKVEIAVKNNVVNPINLGDTVTFEAEINNSGEGEIHEAYIHHEIYSPKGELWSKTIIPIGDLKTQKKGKVVFGIRIDKGDGGSYQTKTFIQAKDDKSNSIQSNDSQTNFGVKIINNFLKQTSKPVEAIQNTENNVLGEKQIQQINLIPYLILFFSSGLWLRLKLRE